MATRLATGDEITWGETVELRCTKIKDPISRRVTDQEAETKHMYLACESGMAYLRQKITLAKTPSLIESASYDSLVNFSGCLTSRQIPSPSATRTTKGGGRGRDLNLCTLIEEDRQILSPRWSSTKEHLWTRIQAKFGVAHVRHDCRPSATRAVC